MQKWPVCAALFLAPMLWTVAHAQTAKELGLESGEQIFQATCAGCHAPDGKGQPQHVLGFEPPATFPDFTDCSGSSRESNTQWSAVIHQGGTARSFSTIMPSFGPKENPLLSDDEIKKVIGYLRSFCTDDPKWPSGDFNVPRPMFTEKAFPEDELVDFNTVNLTSQRGYNNNLIIEKRLGAITNLEIRFRGNFAKQASGSWFGDVGDTSFEFKRSVVVNNKRGTLVGWGNEITLASGNPRLGGNGVHRYEQFLTLTQLLPKRTYFLQQVGGEVSIFHRHQSPAEAYTRTMFGKTFLADKSMGRAFSVSNELIAIRKFGPRQAWTLDVVPQAQITVSKRQHMRLGVGVSIPAVNVQSRSTQLVFYWLWDTFDGGLFEGWK
jgi:mono/diheme cytochrome c family protein